MGIKIVKGNLKNKKSSKMEKEKDVSSYALPTEKSKRSDSLQDYTILIYGNKKIGKTSLTAQFENTLCLMTEPGGKAQEMYQVSCRDWKSLRGYTKSFIANPKYKTASVDTADFAYEFCMDYVCKKMVIDHPSDEGYGKGWKAVRTEFQSWITELLHSGKGIIFISHSRDSEFKTRKGDSFNKVGASMSGQAKEILEGLVDIWANYEYDGKKRYLIIGGSDEVDAGNRVEGHFLDTDGQPLDRIPMGNSAKEAYRNFIAAFENRLEAAREKAVTTEKKKLVIKRK